MKKKLLNVLVVTVLLACTNAVQAQGLGDILKNAASTLSSGGSSTTQTVVGSLLDGLIGTAKVTPATLAGTWDYEKPAVAFESSNLLKKAGASVMASTIETKLQSYLTKIGFTAGSTRFTFTEDGSFTMNLKGKNITGTYTVDGATLTLQRKGLIAAKPITANVKVSGSEMQVTFKADKLLNFVTDFASASSISTLQTIGKLANGVDGMQIGFKFNK